MKIYKFKFFKKKPVWEYCRQSGSNSEGVSDYQHQVFAHSPLCLFFPSRTSSLPFSFKTSLPFRFLCQLSIQRPSDRRFGNESGEPWSFERGRQRRIGREGRDRIERGRVILLSGRGNNGNAGTLISTFYYIFSLYVWFIGFYKIQLTETE